MITVAIYVQGAAKPVRSFTYRDNEREAAEKHAERLREQINDRGWNQTVEVTA